MKGRNERKSIRDSRRMEADDDELRARREEVATLSALEIARSFDWTRDRVYRVLARCPDVAWRSSGKSCRGGPQLRRVVVSAGGQTRQVQYIPIPKGWEGEFVTVVDCGGALLVLPGDSRSARVSLAVGREQLL